MVIYQFKLSKIPRKEFTHKFGKVSQRIDNKDIECKYFVKTAWEIEAILASEIPLHINALLLRMKGDNRRYFGWKMEIEAVDNETNSK